MQARYQHPVTGRFLSVDPVEFLADGRTGMVNRYSYTLNDPVNGTDPDGMFRIDIGISGKASALIGVKGGLNLSYDTNGHTIGLSAQLGARTGVAGEAGLTFRISESADSNPSSISVGIGSDAEASAGFAKATSDGSITASTSDGISIDSDAAPQGALGAEAIITDTGDLGGTAELGLGVDAGITASGEINISLSQVGNAIVSAAQGAVEAAGQMERHLARRPVQ